MCRRHEQSLVICKVNTVNREIKDRSEVERTNWLSTIV